MRNRPLRMTRARKNQGGYALLLVVFFTALLVVGTMSVGLRILTEGKRQKEQEMIWRGQQYTRGIKLYYRKLGRFPTSMDDLTKPKIGNLRFMRQAYKDPMNKEDGSWRLIYVGPAGQLIGSLNPSLSNVQMPAAAGQTPGNATTTVGGQSGTLGGLGSSTTSGTSTQANGQGTTGSTPGTTGTGTAAQGTDTTGTGTAVPMGDTPTLVGGSIIGIGSMKPPQQNLQLPQAGGIGTPANALNGPASAGQTGVLGLLGGNSQPPTGGQPGQTGTPPAGTVPGTNSPATTGTPVSADQGGSSSDPSGIPSGDTPTIIGGNIIGVGSKVNKSSIIIYDKAKNYRLFEFIWDPSKDAFGVGQPGLQTGTGLGQPAGQTPFGQQPGQQPGQSPLNPPQNPPPQSPPPQQ